MKVSEENSADKLVDRLLGKAKPPTNLPALKYGRDMVPIAVEEFIKYFKKHHKNVTYSECGIFIEKTKQYLGASPDLLIQCFCRGEAIRFNATYWHRLEEKLTWVYINCLSPALKLLQK